MDDGWIFSEAKRTGLIIEGVLTKVHTKGSLLQQAGDPDSATLNDNTVLITLVSSG